MEVGIERMPTGLFSVSDRRSLLPGKIRPNSSARGTTDRHPEVVVQVEDDAAPQAIEEAGALAAAIEVVEGARKNAMELAAEERFEVDVDVNGKRAIVRGVRSRK